MPTLSFFKTPNEKLDYTFDFTNDLTAIGETIEGSPTITISPSGLTNVSASVLAGNKKVMVVLSGGTDGVDYSVTCKVNSTGSPDRDFEQGLFILSRARPPIATNGYVTVARAAAELQVTDATQQALLESIIEEATAMVNTFCRRTFHRESAIVERQYGNGLHNILLDKMPLVSIESVTYDGDTISASDYEIWDAGAGIVFRPGTVWQRSSLGTRYIFTYTAGYILPGQSGANLPGDIQRATMEVCKGIFYARKRDSAVRSERVEGVYAVEYATSGAQGGSVDNFITASVENLLMPYRKARIA